MLYIHIGLRKTGSTSIQRFASRNAELLAEHGVIFPSEGRNTAAHHLLKNEIAAGTETQYVDQIVDMLSGTRDGNFVVSSEGLSTLRPDSVARLVEPTKKLHEIRVILYIRSLSSVVVSLYNQNTKRSLNTMPFDQYLARGGGNGKRLARVVETWGNAVGYDALRVRTMQKESLAGGNLLIDFLDAVGLDREVLDRADPESIERANVGVTWETAEYVREFTRRAADMMASTGDAGVKDIMAAKKPRLELVKTRVLSETGRPKMATAFRPGRFAAVVEAALSAAGEVSDAQYLTPEQAVELEAKYLEQLEGIRTAVPDAILHHAPSPPPPPRLFQPDYTHIQAERHAAIAAGIRSTYDWEESSACFRDIVSSIEQASGR